MEFDQHREHIPKHPAEDAQLLAQAGLDGTYPNEAGNAVTGERNGNPMEYRVERIAEGLGLDVPVDPDPAENEKKKISLKKITDGPGGTEALRKVDEAIENPSELLVDISLDSDGNPLDDDGCGDGRITRLIKKGKNVLGMVGRKAGEVINKNRAKVFGGGSAMAMADLIGSGEAQGSLEEAFAEGMGQLTLHEIGYGAHSDTHAHGENCGCGAIDKAPLMVKAVAENLTHIRGVFGVLKEKTGSIYSSLMEPDYLDDITENFGRFAERTAGQPYRGSNVMDRIERRGKIVKQLDAGHVEGRIILNCIEGKTVDQGLIHRISDGKVDAFVVDVWRVQSLATRLHPGDRERQARAFQSMLAYTLGVAAVLTKGDLPVYVVQSASETEPANTPKPELAAA